MVTPRAAHNLQCHQLRQKKVLHYWSLADVDETVLGRDAVCHVLAGGHVDGELVVEDVVGGLDKVRQLEE